VASYEGRRTRGGGITCQLRIVEAQLRKLKRGGNYRVYLFGGCVRKCSLVPSRLIQRRELGESIERSSHLIHTEAR
jgi:hypothetical protein